MKGLAKRSCWGLLAAVERYLNLDHDARARSCEETVAMWNEALGAIDGVTARRDFPNEAGQPLPRTLLTIRAEVAGKSRDDVVSELLAGEPAIAVAAAGSDGIHLNPMILEPGEAEVVRDRLLEILR